jgi:hypothetical protein
VLHAGDSIYFDSNLRHAYKRLGDEKCTAFMVFAYPERNMAERRMDRLEGVHAIRHPVQSATGAKPQLAQRTANGNGSFVPKKVFQQSA